MGLFVMCVATTIALPAGYKRPDLHHPSYKAFLHTWVYGASSFLFVYKI